MQHHSSQFIANFSLFGFRLFSNATLRTESHCEFLTIEKQDFDALLKDSYAADLAAKREIITAFEVNIV